MSRSRSPVKTAGMAPADVGELDAEGNLYFKGRKKSVIVTSAGMNVYPEDLEAALRRQPEVRDAVVVGLPRNGNADACAVLILRDGGDAEAIVKRANDSLAQYQRMNRWLVWPEDDFPRTSTQKPRRTVIAETVQANWQAARVSKPSSSPLTELIGRISSRSTTHLSPGANLETDLNLSSLDRVELLGALEDRYQIELSETRFAAINTVGDLERVLRGRRFRRDTLPLSAMGAALAGHLRTHGCALSTAATRCFLAWDGLGLRVETDCVESVARCW